MESSTHIFNQFRLGNLKPFYDKDYPDLLIYAASIMRGSDMMLLAEDCVQDAVEKAYHRRNDFTSVAQWKMFMLACVRNRAVSMLRSGNASRNYVNSISVEEASGDYMLDYIREETMSRLMTAIESLPEELRAIFDLSFEEGLRNAEVAKRLNIAEITVKKRKARMIDRLRRMLGDEYMIVVLLIA